MTVKKWKYDQIDYAVSADQIAVAALNAGTEPDEDAAGHGVDDKLVSGIGAGELDIPELVSVDLVLLS